MTDENGKLWRGEFHCERILVSYFSELFETYCPLIEEDVLEVVKDRLRPEHIAHCEDTFTGEEVKEALFQMHPLKAPGPDGLPSLFYQKYWNIVGPEITHLALEVLNNNMDPSSINNTFIALIPKCKHPKSPKDYRPISLCNVLMKIITKTIANRIKSFLPDIIDEEQSAFVKGRLITDNALVALECFHWMKKKKKGKRGFMALKLDMSKAYDRVEWDFIFKVLYSMGFPEKFVKLIVNCVSTVSYKILLNGQPTMSFIPGRGLRQGDPLSPYLFILCANVFSGLLKKGVADKQIHGVKVARSAPVISHLFFADDSLLFSRANSNEARKLLDILHQYQTASGQIVNFEKSEASFSSNVSNADKANIQNIMRVNTVQRHTKYLGIPLIFGRSKKDIFKLVVDRVQKKVKGWKEKVLSKVGKEVLIKAVAQAIPNYIMGCYKMPEAVCHEIESIVSKFWWGSKEGERKIHWMRRERMAIAKKAGGLGFRGFSEFNKSLLGKHFWRLMKEEGSLFERVFKSRYYPNRSIQDSKLGFNTSYAWRSIFSSRELVLSGTRWCIGNGDKVVAKKDNWIPTIAGFKVVGQMMNSGPEVRVSHFIDHELSIWRTDLVEDTFEAGDAKHILGIPLSRRRVEDSQVWHYEESGEYSVRTAYHLCMQDKAAKARGPSATPSQELWKKIWNAPIHTRIKHFLWRLANNILPTKAKLRHRGVILEETCGLCQQGIESANHLFTQCDFTRRAFFASVTGYHCNGEVDINVWLVELLSNRNVFFVQVSCYLLHQIWKARNLKLYQQKEEDPVKVAMDAGDAVMELNQHNPTWSKDKSLVNMDNQRRSDADFHTVKVDAGLDDNALVTFGCVILDKEEMPLLSLCKKEAFSTSPGLAECMALRWSMETTIKLNLRNVLFQSDAKAMVDCVNAVTKDVCLGVVADDCRNLLKFFTNADVMFIPRKFNSVAHDLAQLAKSVGSKTWLGACPVVEDHSSLLFSSS
ncbi:uncharacterized protein LOC131594996 [Vicia villosa]|uniref:uncharacterized protein LOC131594996 n=1 Tax=Vicia villosa TaxID=3911 RepID=UPI00273AC960|nr:uncharacterized protein LOC131594996 [Vicia villosa]